MTYPKGAGKGLEEIKSWIGTICYLLIPSEEPPIPDYKWKILGGRLTDVYPASRGEYDNYYRDKTYIHFDNHERRYFFYNETGGFPWSGQDVYLFRNYWLALGHCLRLNDKSQGS